MVVLDKDGILNEAKLENLRNKKIEEAVTKTVEQIREKGYLEPEAEAAAMDNEDHLVRPGAPRWGSDQNLPHASFR